MTKLSEVRTNRLARDRDELGQELAAHPRFRPAEGALYVEARGRLERWASSAPFDVAEVRIDDPATQGTLLAAIADELHGGMDEAMRLVWPGGSYDFGVNLARTLIGAWVLTERQLEVDIWRKYNDCDGNCPDHEEHLRWTMFMIGRTS